MSTARAAAPLPSPNTSGSSRATASASATGSRARTAVRSRPSAACGLAAELERAPVGVVGAIGLGERVLVELAEPQERFAARRRLERLDLVGERIGALLVIAERRVGALQAAQRRRVSRRACRGATIGLRRVVEVAALALVDLAELEQRRDDALGR